MYSNGSHHELLRIDGKAFLFDGKEKLAVSNVLGASSMVTMIPSEGIDFDNEDKNTAPVTSTFATNAPVQAPRSTYYIRRTTFRNFNATRL